jgi:hypothetical protein
MVRATWVFSSNPTPSITMFDWQFRPHSYCLNISISVFGIYTPSLPQFCTSVSWFVAGPGPLGVTFTSSNKWTASSHRSSPPSFSFNGFQGGNRRLCPLPTCLCFGCVGSYGHHLLRLGYWPHWWCSLHEVIPVSVRYRQTVHRRQGQSEW